MQAGAITIRPASAADRDDLAALLLAQLRDHGIATSDKDVVATVDALLPRTHRARFLVAVEGGRTVGVAAMSFGWPVEHAGRGAWLEELYVRPEARGRGTGTRLLEAALDLARAQGVRAVDLEIERGHQRVASLYLRHGFRPLERARWVKPLDRSPPVRRARPATVTGGCLCGAVRYEIQGPVREVSYCHCPSCRRAAAAPVVAWATFPHDTLRFVRGAPAAFASSPPVSRTFCATCGTPLTYVTRNDPEWIDVTVGSMDAPECMAPDDHIWTESRLPWFVPDDDLPRLPRDHE
jgi:GNAT superfamily N-acetyltransferase